MSSEGDPKRLVREETPGTWDGVEFSGSKSHCMPMPCEIKRVEYSVVPNLY